MATAKNVHRVKENVSLKLKPFMNIKLRNFLKSRFVDLFVIICFVLVFGFKYLLDEGVPYYFNSDLSGSASYVITRSNELLKGFIFSSWWSTQSRPAFNIDPLFFAQLEAFLYLITRNLWLNYKLLQVLQLIIAGISAYLLAHFYTKGRLCSFITAILYMFTPYFLGKLATHANTLSWAYSLLPLGYLSIEKALSKGNIRNTMTAGLIVALTTFLPSFNYTYVNGLFYLLFAIIKITLSEHAVKNVIRKLIITLSIFIIAFAISAYTVIPTLLEPFPLSTLGQIDLERRYREGLSGVWSPTLIEVLSFQDKEILIHGISTGRFNEIMEPWLLFLSIMVTLVAAPAFLFKHNKAVRRSIFAFSISGLLSILFALGSKAPLVQPYVWLHDLLPFFYTIRTTSRFEIHFCLAFTYLASLTISKISQQLYTARFKLRFSKVLSPIVVIILILPLIIETYYNLSIGPSHLLETTILPDDVATIQQFWRQQPDINDYRTLDLTVPGDYFDQTYNLGTHGLYYGWDLVKKYYGTQYFAAALAAHNIKYLIYDPIKTRELLMERGLDPDIFINNVVNNSMDWEVKKVYGSQEMNASTLIVASSSDWFFGEVNESIATTSYSVVYSQAMHKITNIRISSRYSTLYKDTKAKILFYLIRIPENQILLVEIKKSNSTVFKKEVNSSNLKYGWNIIEMKEISVNENEDYSVIFSAPYANENNYFLLGQKRTDQPSKSSWSRDGKVWTPYNYGRDIMVKISYGPIPEKLGYSLASYDEKASVLTLGTKFDVGASKSFYVYEIINNPAKYEKLIFKAKVSDPYTQMVLKIVYSDNTDTTFTYSGWIWRTLTVNLQPNKIVTEVRLFIKPLSDKVIDKNFHSIFLGTLDLYVLVNKKVLPKIYASKGYWLEGKFVTFNPGKHYSINLNFSTREVLESILYNTTNIKYDSEQKRIYFVDPGSIVWRFEAPYPIIGGVVRAKLNRNVLEGSDICLYISSDNRSWMFLGHPARLGETDWISGELIRNITTFYVKIESSAPLGGSIFGLQIYAELDTPKEPVQITFQKISSTEYVVHVNASSPFYLINTETYFPGWSVFLGSDRILPEPIDDKTIQGFYIDKPGVFDIRIVYENTFIRELSFLTSGTAFLLTTFYTVFATIESSQKERSKNAKKQFC